MASINRREMIGGALALVGGGHLPLAFAVGERVGAEDNESDSVSLPAKPEDLLARTFTPELFAKSLIPMQAWHPYPKVNEREAWHSVPADIGDSLVRRAQAVVGTPWPSIPATLWLEFRRRGNQTDFQDVYYPRRQRLTDLVLGECIEGKGRFVDEIINGVWMICEETFWGHVAHLSLQKEGRGSGLPQFAEPVVDLFAAETAATLSWIHYLLGAKLDEVSPLVTKRIVVEAKRRILDPALERDDFWWMWAGVDGKHHLNNWNPWINSNWMVTNLLLEQDPARRVTTMSRICKSLDRYIAQFSPDAGSQEGPGYWTVAAGSYFNCCSTLASATGGAANVLSNPFIRRMTHFILDIHIADGYYVDYGDGNPRIGPPPEFAYRIGTGTGDKALAAFGAFYLPSPEAIQSGAGSVGQEALARAIPDILGTAKARSAQKADALERDAWYPALGLMTARAKAGSSEGFYLAVQAAVNLRSHGHNDSGSFIVFHKGEPVFIDVGVEAYSAKTFSPDRYDIWTMQSAYHNLPTVGGVMQSAAEAEYRASDVHHVSDDARAGLTMNLATAYPAEAGITRWTRSVTLDRAAGRIRLNEDFQLQRRVPVALSFMTSRVPSLGPKGSVVLTAAGKGVSDVALRYDASLAVASFEKIELQDPALRRAWGASIYRVLLTSTAPTDGGKWAMEIG